MSLCSDTLDLICAVAAAGGDARAAAEFPTRGMALLNKGTKLRSSCVSQLMPMGEVPVEVLALRGAGTAGLVVDELDDRTG